ncbi:MAG: hypothetical protein ACLFTK_10800 [Anaerolineales bacterium]
MSMFDTGAYSETPSGGGWRRSLRSCAVFGLTFFVFFGGGTVFIDQTCISQTRTYMPLYPNAEVVSEEYTYFRPFGIGETRVIMRTADAEGAVRRWYREIRREAYRETGEGMPGLAQIRMGVIEADESGTTLSLNSFCVTH